MSYRGASSGRGRGYARGGRGAHGGRGRDAHVDDAATKAIRDQMKLNCDTWSTLDALLHDLRTQLDAFQALNEDGADRVEPAVDPTPHSVDDDIATHEEAEHLRAAMDANEEHLAKIQSQIAHVEDEILKIYQQQIDLDSQLQAARRR